MENYFERIQRANVDHFEAENKRAVDQVKERERKQHEKLWHHSPYECFEHMAVMKEKG
jgi:hypothetical protein